MVIFFFCHIRFVINRFVLYGSIYFSWYVCCLKLIILLLTIAYVIKHQQISAERAADQLAPPPTAVSQNVLPTETQITYCLREFDGGLAVFRGDSPDPYKKIEVNLSLMTDEDKELLRKGITAQSEKELKKVIEDFTS